MGFIKNIADLGGLIEALRAKMEGFVVWPNVTLFYSRLQCVYCEKTFKSAQVLKKHMKEKKHCRVNPWNTNYDVFYQKGSSVMVGVAFVLLRLFSGYHN
jgi:hypothetical protein